MKRLLFIGGVLALVLFVLLFAAGSVRYGGPDGLVIRVRAQFITEERPSDQSPFVPTPQPTQTPTATSTLLALPAEDTTVSQPALTPTEQATNTPEPTATPQPAPTATPVPLYSPAGTETTLSGLSHYWQTWNNCGPATLAMNLSYFDIDVKQEAIRRLLRPNREDKNVNPWELASFAQSQGLVAKVRVNGTTEHLRLLLSNGIPVLIETWLEPEPNDGMGHYRLLTGYDDDTQNWITYDSYVSTGVKPNQPYRGIRIPYSEIDAKWPVFNNTYLVIYTDEQAPIVESILGADMDDDAMWQNALNTAQEVVSRTPEDAFAWFNLGTDLVALGRYQEAADAYDRARVLGLPWRMLWYQFGPFEAYYEVGRYDEVLALANTTLKTTPYVEELHYWRGKALQALGEPEEARRAFQQALKQNKHYEQATIALASIAAQ